MYDKQEILEKLTGIQSSRKSYYSELTYLIEELKKKNNQLAVINQLSQIQISATWPETSIAIASQLKLILPFEHFALTLVQGGSLTTYLSCWNGTEWQCQSLSDSALAKPAHTLDRLHQSVQEVLPACQATSVPLHNLLKQTFGILTILHRKEQRISIEEYELFQLTARHVRVCVENILLFQDLSEKVKIEAQLVQSAKMAAIGEIAAGIAHELNSPLTAILGNSQLLMREMGASSAAPLMNDIYRCGVRCKKIIQNLLTFSRQEEYQHEDVAINDVVEDALGLIGYQLTVSGLSIQFEKAPSPLAFFGSRHQIEQIVINLLLNARDALPGREDPLITIHTFLQQEQDRPYVGLSVHDNGSGILPEHLPQIFQPFFSTKERAKGTGLGLSVSLGIAAAHGGKLLVESEYNQYSKFTLLLPQTSDEEVHDGEETDLDSR